MNKMLSMAGADRLQQGMRGAWGRPTGIVARVEVGQVLVSVRTVDRYRNDAIEALRRAAFKFPGCQNVIVSRKWGFTSLEKGEFAELQQTGKLRLVGNGVKVFKTKGNLEATLRNFPAVF
jgi:large subunit ribosomal protein L10e